MVNRIDHHVIPDFLLKPEFKGYRILLFQCVVLLISISVFFDTPDKLNVSASRFWGWIGYFLVLNLLILINAYILAPRYLIQNRLFMYTGSALLLMLLSILILIILQTYFYDAGETLQHLDPIALFLNVTSSILSVGLLIIGTSAFLLFKHWVGYSRRIDELESLNLRSELKYLKNQINPHFLFNMLNNANIMVNENPVIASHILAKLDDLLRYQINDSAREKVYLNADILFLTDFLDLEKTRRDHFDYTVSKEGDIDCIEIPPLLFIPFIENAVKHSSDNENMSYIHIHFKAENNLLLFTCKNSKPPKMTDTEKGGLGLTNIKRRLDLLYGNHYALELKETETTYTANLKIMR